MWESDETTETTGSWCRRPWKRSRASRCSAGARHQNAMSSCGCCGASRSRPSRGRSGLSRSGSSSGRAALAALDAGLKDRPEDDPLQAVWAPPIAGGRAGHGKRTAAREDRPAGGWRAFSPGEVAQVSAAISPATGRSYGVQRVCRVWCCRAHHSITLQTATRRRGLHAAVRRHRSRKRACWRRSKPISRAHRSAARGTQRSGPGCATGLGCGSDATGCCG